jgi:Fe-S-cluster-containing hydrogenase component 2
MPAKGWIEVSDQYCKGCELCISACPPQVMELDMSRLTPRGYHPAHTYKEKPLQPLRRRPRDAAQDRSSNGERQCHVKCGKGIRP